MRVRKADTEGVQDFKAKVVHKHDFADVALLAVPGLSSGSSMAVDLIPPASEDLGRCAILMGMCNPINLFDTPALPQLPGVSPGSLQYGLLI